MWGTRNPVSHSHYIHARLAPNLTRQMNSSISLTQAYLKHLEKTSKLSTASGSSDRGVALVGVRCLCDLLPSMAHFNFATNLLNAVVALALKTPDTQVRTAADVQLSFAAIAGGGSYP